MPVTSLKIQCILLYNNGYLHWQNICILRRSHIPTFWRYKSDWIKSTVISCTVFYSTDFRRLFFYFQQIEHTHVFVSFIKYSPTTIHGVSTQKPQSADNIFAQTKYSYAGRFLSCSKNGYALLLNPRTKLLKLHAITWRRNKFS